MQENTTQLIKFATKLAKESAQILLSMQARSKIVTHKNAGDFALNSDIASEKHIISSIHKKYPNHSIFSEEIGKSQQKSDYLWIIDPLEGTLNYKHHLPLWGVNIALLFKEKPLISVMYCPPLNELFHAISNRGAYLNNKRIHVNTDTDLTGSFFAGNSSHLVKLPLSIHLLRHLGCSALELAYVACGRFSARIKLHGLDPFGYATGSLLVTEAGGKITDLNGKPWTLHSKGALASNGKIHGKLLAMINKIS